MSEEKALATRTGGLQIRSVDELARVADMMAKSGYFEDARDAAKAGVKIMAGQDWGISPFDAMTGIHVIEGKPSVGAGLMAARVKASEKYDYKVLEMSSTTCRLQFYEDGEPAGVSEFTIADAKAAGVQFQTSRGYPTSWSKFPRNMLFARAMSNGVRWYCPDVFTTPVYTAEELGAEVDGEGNVIDVQSRPRQAAPESRQLDAAPAPAAAEPRLGEPISEDEPPVTAADLQDDSQGEAEQASLLDEQEGEPGVTPSQLKAIHTRVTKLGFNGTKESKEAARAFISHLVGRVLESSKDLTKSEAHRLMDLDDNDLGLRLDEWNAERQMAAEGEA